MVEVKVKARAVGATARVGRHGHPRIVSETGGQLDVVTGASAPGFNPLDLLYSSLAACLVLSARIAASRLGILDKLEDVCVHVTGHKSSGEPARVEVFEATFELLGDFDAQERAEITHMAEEICTVSNTLLTKPVIRIL
ncbi:OsmC family protein [Neorhizobium sp. NPDC001467]|uniref:OsmC family protein n=1 Tax=Neorhizobium sp. NPDC001467 TaxID=3390595 RepID=UPI003D03F30D